MNKLFYKIIFENKFVVIVDKRHCVLSVPSRMGHEDTRPVLGKILERDLAIQLYPIHRLDFEVTGLIMYAKDPESQSIATRWFENKEILKTYYAKTKTSDENNFVINQQMSWECSLLKGKKRAYEGAHGKKSLTKAVLVKKIEDYSFYELNPITGRSHQLRYELFRHKEPIIGDKLYGSDEDFSEGIALQSFKLDLKNCSQKIKLDLPDVIEIEKKI